MQDRYRALKYFAYDLYVLARDHLEKVLAWFVGGFLQTLGPEAFLSHPLFAPSMARFPEAERRLLHKMICMQCYARNAPRATRCRKCGSRELRPKAKEARKE